MSRTIDRNSFHPKTINYMDDTPLPERKERGQFFTPAPIRRQLLDKLPSLESPDVLDPAAGTGEFLLDARNHFRTPNLTGWDVDEELVEIARTVVPAANFEQRNSLEANFEPRYDVVIGNPPYFEFQPSTTIRDRYDDVIHGRVNIYTLFFKLGIEQLKAGGWLGFVVSSSMTNGAYFAKLREYILNNSAIQDLEVLDDHSIFDGAQQSVMLIVLRKGKESNRYTFNHNGHLIFSEQASELKKRYNQRLTLGELGWDVKTGRVVWNQHKNKLTNDSESGVPLIWSHNLTEEGLRIPHDQDRPQYIEWERTRTGPAIVVNRVTGAGTNASVKAGLIPDGMEYVAENHTNVIRPPMDEPAPIKQCKNIIDELRDPDNLRTIRAILGNTQLSCSELRNLFPIGTALKH